MQFLLDWLRDPESRERPTQLESLQNQAIAPLEAALRAEAGRAFDALRTKLRKFGGKAAVKDAPEQRRTDTTPTRQLAPLEFVNRIVQSLNRGNFSVSSFTTWWDSERKRVVFTFTPQTRELIITDVPEEILTRLTDVDAARFVMILASHESGEVSWLAETPTHQDDDPEGTKEQ